MAADWINNHEYLGSFPIENQKPIRSGKRDFEAIDNIAEEAHEASESVGRDADQVKEVNGSKDSAPLPDVRKLQLENAPDESNITPTDQKDDETDDEGHPVPIIRNVAGNFELDNQALEKILLRDDVKDCPVAVVSIVGVFRKGKSFILDYIMRYLKYQETAQDGFIMIDDDYEDNDDADSIIGLDNWVGSDDEPLTGFSWRGGKDGDTSGILMWSKPFKLKLEDGTSIAVILMDTQGTFDRKAANQQNALIFGLATLCSSIQIFNIQQNIDESQLSHLLCFTEYGKMALKNQTNKQFQKLVFLLRDWSYPYEYSYGSIGGKKFIEDEFDVNSDQAEEAKNIRRRIDDCFVKISGFLMPHPGSQISKQDFDGSFSKLEPEFQSCIKEFVSELFDPTNMFVKNINGQDVKCRDLLVYMKNYFEIFDTDDIPSAKNIYQSTAEATHLMALNEAKELYKEDITLYYKDQTGYDEGELKSVHEKSLNSALECFNNKKKMGDRRMNARYQKYLQNEILQIYNMYQNLLKDKSETIAEADTMLAASKARQSYNGQMSSLCETSNSLSEANLKIKHEEFRDNSLKGFHEFTKTTNSNIRLKCQHKLQKDINMDYQNYQKVFKQKNQVILHEQALLLHKKAKELYNTNIPKIFKMNIETMEEGDALMEHQKWLAEALSYFDKKTTIYDEQVLQHYLQKLKEDIQKDWGHYEQLFKQKKKFSSEALCNKALTEAKNSYHCGMHTFLDENKEYCTEIKIKQTHNIQLEQIAYNFSQKTAKITESFTIPYKRKLYEDIETEFAKFIFIVKTRNEALDIVKSTKAIGDSRASYNNQMSQFSKSLTANLTKEDLSNHHKKFSKSSMQLFLDQCKIPDKTFKKSWENRLKRIIDEDYVTYQQIFQQKSEGFVNTKYMNSVRHARENYNTKMMDLISKGKEIESKEFESQHIQFSKEAIVNFKGNLIPGYDDLKKIHIERLREGLNSDYKNFKDILEQKQVSEQELETMNLVTRIRESYNMVMSEIYSLNSEIISETIIESKHKERLEVAFMEYDNKLQTNNLNIKLKYRMKLDEYIKSDYKKLKGDISRNNATNIAANNSLALVKAKRIYSEKIANLCTQNIDIIDNVLLQKYHDDCLAEAFNYLNDQENRGDEQTRLEYEDVFTKDIEEEFLKMKNNVENKNDLLVKHCFHVAKVEARDHYYDNMMNNFSVDQDSVSEKTFTDIHNKCFNEAMQIFDELKKSGFESIEEEFKKKLEKDIGDLHKKFKKFNSSSKAKKAKDVPVKPKSENWCSIL